MEDVQLLSRPKAPLIIENADFLSIQIDQQLRSKKKYSPENYAVIERDNIKILPLKKDPLKTEYIDELNIQGYKKPENEIQLIDQMEILPLERENLIVQNIDNLVIFRDYDHLQYLMKPIWDSLDVQASGGLKLVSHKVWGLERQEIDNFEIIGSINAPILEQEYINSIEIVERNSILTRQRLSLDIEYMDDLQISPNRNDVRYINVNVPRQNYEIDVLDDIEIIGRNQEDLQVEQIDNISLQDKIIRIQNSEQQRIQNIQISEQQRIQNIQNTEQNSNLRPPIEYDVNYNENRLKPPRQMNQEYSSEDNENVLRYRDDSYNINISQQQIKSKPKSAYGSIEQDKYRIIRRGNQDQDYDQGEEQIYEREDWNKFNDIQKENNIFIKSSQEGRPSYMQMGYGMESSMRNNWNEKNRTQGIVNLSVIDDNKKQPWNLDLDNAEEMVDDNRDNSENRENSENRDNNDNRENSDEEHREENNDINNSNNINNNNNIDNNNNNINNREFRKIHNDYDSDELNDLDPLKGLEKHGKQTKYDDYIKTQQQKRYSKKGDEDDDKDKDKKYQYKSKTQQGGSRYIISQENQITNKNLKDKSNTGKYKPASVNYMIGEDGGREEEDLKDKKVPKKYNESGRIIKSGDNLKDNVYQRKYEPGKKYIIGHGSHVSGKDDEEDLKEEKGPGQQKSSTGNYVIRSQIKDDKSNIKKRQIPYKPTSINYAISQDNRREDPKIIVSQPKTQFKSQPREVTGMMKRKAKVKKYEYLRDSSQGQNFQ